MFLSEEIANASQHENISDVANGLLVWKRHRVDVYVQQNVNKPTMSHLVVRMNRFFPPYKGRYLSQNDFQKRKLSRLRKYRLIQR